MNIAFVHFCFGSGGAERITINIAEYLSGFGKDYKTFLYANNIQSDRLTPQVREFLTVREISKYQVERSIQVDRLVEEDKIDIRTQVGLSLMYAFQVVPLIAAYWLLSRVFSNVHEGEIFTERNAHCLLYYGVLQFSVGLLVPFVKLLICNLVNLVSSSRMSLSTGQDMLNSVIPSIAFMVAAYIIHYGIHLQDEVDHTL